MGKLPLEGFKFAVYIVMPVVAVTYFQRPEVFRKIIENRNYIQYPPEEERSPEDLVNTLQKQKLKQNAKRSDRLVHSPSTTASKSGGASSISNDIGKISAEATSIPWRRYIFFGPRDDPEALKIKRSAKMK